MADSFLADRLQTIQTRIEAAANRAQRDPANVTMVAVSKGHPVESIQEAANAGQKIFGENYLDEAIPKMGIVGGAVEWHMLGHVQRRKAAGVVERFAVVHSVDSLPLAERLSQICVAQNMELTIFLECNISGESTKTGFPASDRSRWSALISSWQFIVSLPGMNVAGLMTMAPYAADPSTTRAVFRSLRALRDAAREADFGNRLTGLSMGMSDDFEIAIEEGATIVRIGRALFGSREPKKSR
jgi:PLP dependent protein